MTKHLAADTLIMLHNRLTELAKRDPKRKLVIREVAKLHSVSVATVYRALRKYDNLSLVTRIDYNRPRLVKYEEMKKYCELIAALKLRTTNKKGRHLSNNACIGIIENYGIELDGRLVKAPTGLLKKSTVSFYLRRFGLEHSLLTAQPVFVRFQARHSNECWQFDFSPSDFKGVLDDKPKQDSGGFGLKLMLASVVDDRSGLMYQQYQYCYGEDVITALKFLFNAMAPKADPVKGLRGIPKTIYTDNGPVAKSAVFKRVMSHLGIEILVHLPDGKDGRRKTARSKGKVERSFLSVKESLETLYHLHPPRNLSEANEWLCNYLDRYNQEKHRSEGHSKLEDWKQNLPQEGFREMCSWEHFTLLAREPETRKVGSDACVNVHGTKYQLTPDLAGNTVTLLWGVLNNELHISYENENYGPFYPADGPIPFNSYRNFKNSSKKEKYINKIEELAKIISVPKSVLTNDNTMTKELISSSNLAEEPQASIAFEADNSFKPTNYKNAIEAKAAISRLIGHPLGRLPPQRIEEINRIIAESLDKKVIVTQVKQLLALKLVVLKE